MIGSGVNGVSRPRLAELVRAKKNSFYYMLDRITRQRRGSF
jgi:hypothetical protein